MQQHSFFADKKILLIDADDKKKNDRTWCFWEAHEGLFQEIVYKNWAQIDFYGPSFSARFDIAPYQYKMIRGKDFYQYVFDKLATFQNVSFLQEKIVRIFEEDNIACVQTATQIITAQYVFNSILFQPGMLQTAGSLLQHFTGWVITTPDDKFNNDVATFMDFRICRPGENTFVYVLPVSSRKALVEYTVFSPELLQQEEYANALRNYISQFLKIETFTIEEEEFGVIPMSTYSFAHNISAVIHIGTAGGQTKGSSGYTFQFIQKHSASIAIALLRGEHPNSKNNIPDKRFKLYDNTLLHVLYNKQLTAGQIFSDLFRRNKPQLILKFLDNETSVADEIKIMSSVPSRIFLPAALKNLFKINFNKK